MHRGQPAEVNVVSEGEGHVSIDSGAGRKKTTSREAGKDRKDGILSENF